MTEQEIKRIENHFRNTPFTSRDLKEFTGKKNVSNLIDCLTLKSTLGIVKYGIYQFLGHFEEREVETKKEAKLPIMDGKQFLFDFD